MFPELIIELLQDGYKVNFNAPGHSMYPTIMANETIMVEPIDPATVRLGDIILYRINGRIVAHRLVGIKKETNDAITLFQSSKKPQSNPIIKGDGPRLKRNAPPAKRASSAALHFALRGDASPVCDEPVKAGQILGKVVSIERNGRRINPYSWTHRLACFVLSWASRIKGILN
jgi:hypothetical protein